MRHALKISSQNAIKEVNLEACLNMYWRIVLRRISIEIKFKGLDLIKVVHGRSNVGIFITVFILTICLLAF
jgi:hypothetical protein